MIGGRVIQIDQGPETKLWAMDTNGDELCVHVQKDEAVRRPELGEEIWWQGASVHFGGPGPRNGEVSLRKIGFSHSPDGCRHMARVG